MTEPKLPLILDTRTLEAHLHDPDLLLVDLSSEESYHTQHIPGAVHLPFPRLIRQAPPAMGLLPDMETLSAVLSDIGLTEDKHVVAYDADGSGKASRLLWTLDVLGHEHYSLLDGGLHAWTNEGHPVDVARTDPRPSRYRAEIRNPHALADKAYVLKHLNDPHVVVLDARSAAEYSGEDKRAERAGHIPGAVNLDWIETMDTHNLKRLKADETLRERYKALGLTPDKEVVVHCQTHHRSAHSFMVLKHLGFERVRGYAGSWSEWGNDPDVPVES
ncbi:sulfurtransferase [Alkalilimnicola sp. S0819]|uniref:sulfurtransferase n=1 Tax=Alkalilimnicola sp. S0819 TaxID=2613922 RepID=UPI00126187D9|nr:sulfurtransferase [Alkalilimnicola sp. S0819]KAB7619751.1 sulfurtransferase [Alkalilimnicola sp. S0819]MPQ17515.1 sulfurtransferase [Alkalilimnicola sp. S0819]